MESRSGTLAGASCPPSAKESDKRLAIASDCCLANERESQHRPCGSGRALQHKFTYIERSAVMNRGSRSRGRAHGNVSHCSWSWSLLWSSLSVGRVVVGVKAGVRGVCRKSKINPATILVDVDCPPKLYTQPFIHLAGSANSLALPFWASCPSPPPPYLRHTERIGL